MPETSRAHINLLIPCFMFLCLLFLCGTNLAQNSAFAYQGKLNNNGNPASGNYDLQFKLYDTADVGTGTQHGGVLTFSTVPVSNGVFNVILDFGACPTCFNGAARFLEIAVRQSGDPTFTTLAPRQPILSSPYAIRSLNAASATTADGLSVACVNCVTSSQIQSVQGSQVTGNIAGSQISGAIPVASVPAGSGNYIQNATSQQMSSNFNIGGNGTAGGTLSANLVNTATQYNMSGLRILSAAGTNNLFLGFNAGASNTGGSNSFFGIAAGLNNTTGFTNSFYGSSAGLANSTGFGNSFFGASAGAANSTACCNSFFGTSSGFNATGGSNAFFGFNAGNANTTGANNAFFGANAGSNNTTSDNNTFFGESTGYVNTGGDNSFFGARAGLSNTTGTGNTFVGRSAGTGNATGSNNTYVGANTSGSDGLTNATAIGANAQVTASNTIVMGTNAVTVQIPGNLNIAGSLSANASGLTNLNAGNITTGTLDNARLGIIPTANGGTGLNAAGAAGNFLRSNGGNWTSAALSASDLPAGSANYIQNTSSPQAGGNFNITGNGTIGGVLNANGAMIGTTLSAGTVNAITQYNIGGSRVFSILGDNNTFVGSNAGAANDSGFRNTFVGSAAGQANTTGSLNAFFGSESGVNNTTGGLNAFFGRRAGYNNISGDFNAFFGFEAGAANQTGFQNAFFGERAGTSNTGGLSNAFFGSSAGFKNTTGNTNAFFGRVAGFDNTTGSDNVFVGVQSGVGSTTGASNTFVGANSGNSNVAGNFNTYIGANAGGSQDITNATAVGAGAQVTQSNALVLGSGANVGIGTTAPVTKLHVVGDVTITGNLSKGGGSFKIDHPLDPENKTLSHSFVESPDMMNIYNGNVTTDRRGFALITLPDYFEALNRDFRYQLTVVGQFAQAIVWRKIQQNRFIIKTDKPRVEVSWQVTGIRQDAYAETHRIPVEEVKPASERGVYLHPDAFTTKPATSKTDKP